VFQAGLAVTYELRLMLEDKDIVKSMHDCRQDSAALFYQMGINLQNIFDAQVWTALTACNVYWQQCACCECAPCMSSIVFWLVI